MGALHLRSSIVVHEDDDDDEHDGGGGSGEGGGSGRSIVVANIGDFRKGICRAGRAMDLSWDHKPDDARAVGGRGRNSR